MAYLPPTVVLAELRHEAFESSVPTGSSDTGLVSKWRPKERVQAAAVFALGTVLDTGFDAAKDGVGGEEESDNDEKVRSQAAIVKNILSVVSDGSPLVRAEVAVALSRFAFSHNKHLKPQHTGLLVCVQSQQPVSWFAAYWKPQPNPILSALPPFTVKASGSGYTTPTQYMSHASIVPSTAASLHRVGETTHSVARDGRIYTSSPLAGPSVLHGSPLSDDSSQHSDTGIVADSTNNGTVNPSRPRPLDNALYSQCVLPMCTLAKDPSPRIASLGRRVLSIIGIEQVVTKSIKPSQPAELSTSTSTSLTGLARSTSWFDMNGGHLPLTFRTPPVIPLRPSYLTGMRRVYSLEFRPHVMSSPDSGLADPLLGTAAPPGPAERSFLPQSTIYNWSCGHFSKPLLTPSDDSEDSIARTEETEKLALDCIAKCQHSASRQPQNQIASWDTKFETGTKFTLLLLFSPVVIASDENERIRVWNYEEATLLNSFESHDYPDKGISKLCLVNELDEGLLLIASSDGSVRLWRDYASNGQQKLVTAFSSVQGHRPGARHIKAVVDWQQQSGCLVDVVKQKMMSGSRGSKRPSEGSDKRSPKRARGQQSVPPPRMNFEKLPMPYKTLPAPPNREKIHVIRKGELNRFEGSIRRVEFMCVQTLRKTGSVVDSLLKKSAQMNPSKMTFFVHNIIKLRTKKKAEGAEEDAEGAEEADPDIPAHTFTRSLRKRVEEDVAIQRAMPNQWSTKHLEKLKAWRQAMHFHEWSCHLRKFGMPPLPSFDMVVRLHRKFEPILSDAFYHLYMLQEQRRVDRSVYNIEGVKRSGPNLYKVDLDRTLRFSTSVIFDDTRPNLMESVAIYIDEEDNILSLDDKTYGNLVRGHLQKGETFDRSRKFNIY